MSIVVLLVYATRIADLSILKLLYVYLAAFLRAFTAKAGSILGLAEFIANANRRSTADLTSRVVDPVAIRMPSLRHRYTRPEDKWQYQMRTTDTEATADHQSRHPTPSAERQTNEIYGVLFKSIYLTRTIGKYAYFSWGASSARSGTQRLNTLGGKGGSFASVKTFLPPLPSC